MGQVKKDLRKRLIAERTVIDPNVRKTWDMALVDRLSTFLAARRPSAIFLYNSFRGEPNIQEVAVRLKDVPVSLPVVGLQGDEMEFFPVLPDTPMRRSRFGILEPSVEPSASPSMPSESTVIVVPAVALDRNGFRLGYGAGYYDRYLISCPNSLTIGICYSPFLLSEVPTDYWDHPLNFICTNDDLIAAGT